MPDWFLSIDVAAESEEGQVDMEQLARLPRFLEHYDATVSGGGNRYGVVLKVRDERPEAIIGRGLEDFQAARHKLDLPDWPLVQLDLITHDEFGRRLPQKAANPRLLGIDEASRLLAESGIEHPLVLGAHEASETLQVSGQRFAQLLDRGDLPQPIARLAATPVWLATSIEAYALRRRTQPGRPPASWKREPAPSERESLAASDS